jgi:hypothetical protein
MTGGLSPLASRFVPVLGTSAGTVGLGSTLGVLDRGLLDAIDLAGMVEVLGLGSEVQPTPARVTSPAIHRVRAFMRQSCPIRAVDIPISGNLWITLRR